MVLQKSFKCTPENGLICVNTDDVSNYIQNKVELFRNYENYTSKQKKIELLEEVLQMYNEDIQNPQIDMSEMSNIVYSDKVNIKQMKRIQKTWILSGNIKKIYNVFGGSDY